MPAVIDSSETKTKKFTASNPTYVSGFQAGYSPSWDAVPGPWSFNPGASQWDAIHMASLIAGDLRGSSSFEFRFQRVADIENKFCALAEQWQDETQLMSSISDMVMNRAYQEIIAMGQEVVPLLLEELQHRPNHWFWAMQIITGEDPVKPGDAGDLDKMTEAWLQWGREHNYL